MSEPVEPCTSRAPALVQRGASDPPRGRVVNMASGFETGDGHGDGNGNEESHGNGKRNRTAPSTFVGGNLLSFAEAAMMLCPLEDAMYRSIFVEQVGDVFVVGFQNSTLDDVWVQQLGEDVQHLIDQRGCRKLVLSLANCDALYSVLLGKLMTMRRHLQEVGGRMLLIDVYPFVHEVFVISKLDGYFDFRPDRATAVRELSGSA